MVACASCGRLEKAFLITEEDIITAQGRDIPCSLLAFHPDYLLTDLPQTARAQVDECFQEAGRYLSRVHIGNL